MDEGVQHQGPAPLPFLVPKPDDMKRHLIHLLCFEFLTSQVYGPTHSKNTRACFE